jgi:OOP family OmpA-OmpF porin
MNLFLTRYQMELNMKKKLLCCALLAGFGMAQIRRGAKAMTIPAGTSAPALASGSLTMDRHVSDNMYGVLGLGRWSPSTSRSTPSCGARTGPDQRAGHPELQQASRAQLGTAEPVDRRPLPLHQRERNWAPYVAFGIGAQEHHDGTMYRLPALGYNPSRTGTDVWSCSASGASGTSATRTCVPKSARASTSTTRRTRDDNYVDGYLGVEFLFPIGPEAARPPPPPPPPAKTCADLDDDGDGVNNCDDKCPGSPLASHRSGRLPGPAAGRRAEAVPRLIAAPSR